MGKIGRLDAAHLALMLGALTLSYVLPFELLLLSYAVLGPAHYLTEISWLHDRSYFLPHRNLALILVGIAIVALFTSHPGTYGALVWLALIGSVLASAPASRLQRFVAAVLALCATALLIASPEAFAITGTLLPTIIHVSLFTFIFMLSGAMKSRSPVQFALVAMYLVSFAAILIAPPSEKTTIPMLASLSTYYFGGVAPALGSVIGVPHLQFDARIAGLLSFVYTYHYLNWFVKAEVIRWNRIPKQRAIAIAVLSAAATGCYLYDYTLGFTVLLSLSLMHVLLEFPLNAISIRQLGESFVGSKPVRSGRRKAA
ncbi:MAG: hypothetical protein GC166_08335 [Alphaproteobacteria bacterium]|nr:hypothetical protein [Alphaproteobacteria bacterium]